MKKLTATFLSLGLFWGMAENSALASDNKMTVAEADKILIDFGYDAEDLNYYFEENKLELADTILNKPENLSFNNSYLRVDNIALIEYYVNTPEKELYQYSTPEDVLRIKEKLTKLNSTPLEQLMSEYDFSIGEARLLKAALTKNSNYKPTEKFGEKEITTSGNIATSHLKFTMSVHNKSTSTKPEYDITLHHNWQTPFFTDMLRDNVAAAWGGNLDVKNVSALVYYNKGNYWDGKYGAGVGSFAPNYTISPNTGIVFDFDQSKQNYDSQAKSGNYWFTVFQNKKQGYSTSIVSQYAHKLLTVSNVSVSKVPSIVVGIGKDVSDQWSENINY